MLFRIWEAGADLPTISDVTDHVGVTHTLVRSHALIKRILADPATFRPDNALDAITPIPVAALRILARQGFRLPPTLANNGTHTHPAIREIIQRALRQKRVEQVRPWLTDLVRSRVGRFVERLEAGATVDLYAELASDLPLLVLARLVELPEAEAAVVKEFSRAALELFWSPVDGPRQLHLAEVVGRFHRVLRDFVKTAGGPVGELREHALKNGLPPDTPVGALFFLLVAGQETTSQFLTLLMHRLMLSRHALACAVDAIVEEGLRLVPPIPTWRRVAAFDTFIDAFPVPRGRSLILCLAGAGNEVGGPDFAPGAPGSRRHLAFGAGAHRCAGAQLARMEASVVIKAVSPLLLRAQIVRAPLYQDNLSFRMPDSLVICF
jgi:cytochrome P450